MVDHVKDWIRDVEGEGATVTSWMREYLEAHPRHALWCDCCGRPILHERAPNPEQIDQDCYCAGRTDLGDPLCCECKIEMDCEDSWEGDREWEAREYDSYGHGCGNYEFDW